MTHAPRSRVVVSVLLLGLAGVMCTSHSPNGQADLFVTISGTGSGHVSGPGHIDCPDQCSDSFKDGQIITLTAVPDANSDFTGWSGVCEGTALESNFDMTDPAFCDARFDLKGTTAHLQITVDAPGGVAGKVTGTGISCGDGDTDCDEFYPLNTSVQLTLNLPSTTTFVGWDGDCSGFGTAQQIDVPMSADQACIARLAANSSGVHLAPRGGFALDYRAEAGALHGSHILIDGYDNVSGQIVDISNIDVLTSPTGAEYSTCPGSRGGVIYFNSRSINNQDVFYSTCTESRSGASRWAVGSITQLYNLGFEPGKAAHYQDNWLAISDFEFGQLRKIDYSDTPATPVQIQLTPGHRSCPFSLAVQGNYAYVAGREGEVGTSTEECNNYVGVWKVDLSLNTVVDFAKFGTKLRDVAYGADDKVYVTDFAENKVHVLNPATMTLDRSIAVGDGPVGLKLNFDASRMLLTNWNTNKLQYWNLSNDTKLDEVDSGGLHPVDVYTAGDQAFVLNFGDAAGGMGGMLKAFSVQ